MVTEVEAALHVARAGGGIARSLSYQVADDLASGALVRLLRNLNPRHGPFISWFRPRGICRERCGLFSTTQRTSLNALRVIHEERR